MGNTVECCSPPCQSAGPLGPVYRPVGETVDLRNSQLYRAWWKHNLDTPLDVGLLFSDGKILTDFTIFLLERRNWAHILSLWRLCYSRFGLDRSQETLDTCAELAESLAEAMEAYMNAPEGYGNLLDVREWNKMQTQVRLFDKHRGTRTANSGSVALTGGHLVDNEHLMYEFATAAMFGIHTAGVCHAINDNAVALATLATGSNTTAQWETVFPDLALLGCLQNSCFTYTVPPEGTAYSPPTSVLTNGDFDVPFIVEDYCPTLFAQVRTLCGVNSDQYYRSICRPDVEFVEFGTNSQSGAAFFFSSDGKFLLKSTTRLEAEVLLRILPDCLQRLQDAPHSLLGRYLGLYRVHSEAFEYDLFFFVMQSVTQHNHPVHQIYDLKGSKRHRHAKEDDHIKKDLDFEQTVGKLVLSKPVAEQLLETHAQDVRLYAKHQVMDYSVLLHIHDTQKQAESPNAADPPPMQSTQVKMGGCTAQAGSQWYDNIHKASNMQGLDISFQQAATPAHAAPLPTWSPQFGVRSADGRYIYTMMIIDALVPYNWYPKAQVLGQNIISCGRGEEFSRIPPRRYALRQRQMMARMCLDDSEAYVESEDSMYNEEEEEDEVEDEEKPPGLQG